MDEKTDKCKYRNRIKMLSALDNTKGCSKVICQGCKASLSDYGLDRYYAQPKERTRALSIDLSKRINGIAIK